MDQKSVGSAIIISAVVMCLLVGLGALYLPSWGRLQVKPVESVTVVGQAKSQQKTQIAMFSAGVNAYNDDKQAAVDEVNRKVTAIISAVKDFGIPEADIQTQNMSIYQGQENYYDSEGHQKTRPGQWNVGNSVNIKLRNVDQASALANVLSRSGATNVNGPQFISDGTSDASDALMADALKNADDKAAKIAAASGRKLGKVISVTEGYQPAPIYYQGGGGFGGGGGGAPMQPGTDTVTKTMTVTYELE